MRPFSERIHIYGEREREELWKEVYMSIKDSAMYIH